MSPPICLSRRQLHRSATRNRGQCSPRYRSPRSLYAHSATRNRGQCSPFRRVGSSTPRVLMPELACCVSCGDLHKDRSSSTCASCYQPRHRPYTRQQGQRDSLYRSARWKKVRAMVLDRDGYQCVKCHRQRDLIVHHKIEVTARPDLALTLDNLVCLCRACHGRVHSNRRTDANIAASRTTPSHVSFTQ